MLVTSPNLNQSISPVNINGQPCGSSITSEYYQSIKQGSSSINIQPFTVKQQPQQNQKVQGNHQHLNSNQINSQQFKSLNKKSISVFDQDNQMAFENQQHKKQQTIYKKKIVDIIQGLQQSLGVIANKVKTNMNSSTTTANLQSEQALLESAMLAQKLAMLTQNMNTLNNQQTTNVKSELNNKKPKSAKRSTQHEENGSIKRSKKKNQQSSISNGRSTDMSNANSQGYPGLGYFSFIPGIGTGQKYYYKTIEEDDQLATVNNSINKVFPIQQSRSKQSAQDYKVFVEGPHLMRQSMNALNNNSHQRAHSDAQAMFKKSMSQIAQKHLSGQLIQSNDVDIPKHQNNIVVNTNYFFNIPSAASDGSKLQQRSINNNTIASFCSSDQRFIHNTVNGNSITTTPISRVGSQLVKDQPLVDKDKAQNGLQIVQQLLQQSYRRSARPQSASLGKSVPQQKSNNSTQNASTSVTRIKASSIHRRLNQMPTTIFKPSISLHKKSTSDTASSSGYALHFSNQNKNQMLNFIPAEDVNEEQSKSSTIKMQTQITSIKDSQKEFAPAQDNINVKVQPLVCPQMFANRGSPRGVEKLPLQKQNILIKGYQTIQQSSTNIIPTPSNQSKQFLMQALLSQQREMSQQQNNFKTLSQNTSTNPSKKKQLVIKTIKQNECQDSSQQQHKRLKSEGKILNLISSNSLNYVAKKYQSQSRERSLEETKHNSYQRLNHELQNDNNNRNISSQILVNQNSIEQVMQPLGDQSVMLNLKDQQTQFKPNKPLAIQPSVNICIFASNASPQTVKHQADQRKIVQGIEKLITSAYNNELLKPADGIQLTARSDTFSTGYQCPQQNLMSNETTLKKQGTFQNNQPLQLSSRQGSSTLTVEPPQFHHYIAAAECKKQNGQKPKKLESKDSLRESKLSNEYESINHYQSNLGGGSKNLGLTGRSEKRTSQTKQKEASLTHKRVGSTDKKLFLSEEALNSMILGNGGTLGFSIDQQATLVYQQHQIQPKQSPSMNIMPTPKAVQPLSVVVPNSQAVVGGIHENGQHHHRRQKSTAAFNAAFITNSIQNDPNHELAPSEIFTDITRGGIIFERIDTTMSMMLSPRTKEKRRIVKMIKHVFSQKPDITPSSGQPLIKTTADFYRIGKMLGKGAFGRVNLAMHKVTEHLVAVKSMNKQFLSTNPDDSQLPQDERENLIHNERQKLLQELLILQKVATHNKNIVRLFDSFETARHIVFVMELCAGGDLLTYVRRRGCLSEDVTRELFSQAVAAIRYCHKKNIVHRDVKLDNMLLEIGTNGGSATLKLCDFGVSRVLQDPKNDVMTEQCGTPAYIAPEILLGCQQGANGYKGFTPDVWSLGVCLYAMLFGTVPFKASNMNELHQTIIKGKYSLKKKQRQEELSQDLKSLIRGLLEPDPEKRLTLESVRKHPWMLQKPQSKIELFTEHELKMIHKDFTYQEMQSRILKLQKNYQSRAALGDAPLSRLQLPSNLNLTTENNQQSLPLFTEHELDEECGVPANGSHLKNCSTKSLVLAPFNSTWSDKQVQETHHLDPQLAVVDKRIIKYANRVKDLNRQYEMNNNCDLDNGVYNKFVNQSDSNHSDDDEEEDKEGVNHPQSEEICSQNEDSKLDAVDGLKGDYNNQQDLEDIYQEENSLVTSMNGELAEPSQAEVRRISRAPQAPLVSQISDNEEEDEAELERIIRQNNLQQPNEMGEQFQTFLQKQTTAFATTLMGEDERFIIDYELAEQIQLNIGYPSNFVIQSVEEHILNDASTCYHLLEKDRLASLNVISKGDKHCEISNMLY